MTRFAASGSDELDARFHYPLDLPAAPGALCNIRNNQGTESTWFGMNTSEGSAT
jgi:hypothetical protein